MTLIERKVRRAHRQLFINRTLQICGRTLLLAAAGFALTVIVDRVFNTPLPLTWAALTWLVAGIVAGVAWSFARRGSLAEAATALDAAAGLRERISSGLYCEQSDDPFERAVLADAERVSTGITVRRHLPVRWPASMSWAGAATAVALLTLLLPQWDVLADSREDEQQESQHVKQVQVAKAAWEKRSEAIRKQFDDNPLLKEELDKLDEMKTARMESTQDLQRETIKRLESLRESLERKREETKYESVEELKKMLNRLPKEPQEKDSPVNKLSDALSKGDFSEAKESLKELQEKLAKADSPEDAALKKELEKKLEALAKQIEAAAEQKKIEEKLEGEGLKKEDIERLMASLEKKDMEAVKKALEEKGMSEQQAKDLAKQLAKSQAAQEMAKKLAQSMQSMAQGSASMSDEMSDAAGEAMGQLSDIESLEMEMAELSASMAELDGMQDGAESSCSQCNGSGMKDGQACGKCGGSGSGPPSGGQGEKMAEGRGGLADEQQTATGWKKEKAPVKTTEGRIIGKTLVPGEQYKGDVSAEYQDVVISGQREATEALEHERIPQQYRKAVGEYFRRDGGSAPEPQEPKDE